MLSAEGMTGRHSLMFDRLGAPSRLMGFDGCLKCSTGNYRLNTVDIFYVAWSYMCGIGF